MFSVIIPAYNSASTIVEVLDSVFNQTRFDLIDEIIVVNDGSSDDTSKIVEEYAETHKKIKIKLINQSNKGVSGARNTGIRVAKGKWIALLDSDDCWLPQKLELQYRCVCKYRKILFLGASTVDVFKIGFVKVNSLINANAKQLCLKNFPLTSTVVFLKECINEIGLFDEKMRYGEDINFYQKFLIKYDNYYFLPIKLVEYGITKRFHGDNGLSANFKKMHLARCKNTKELYEAHKISFLFYIVMQMLNRIKYFRRRMLRLISKIITKL